VLLGKGRCHIKLGNVVLNQVNQWEAEGAQTAGSSGLVLNVPVLWDEGALICGEITAMDEVGATDPAILHEPDHNARLAGPIATFAYYLLTGRVGR
jgi:hypothetical protein